MAIHREAEYLVCPDAPTELPEGYAKWKALKQTPAKDEESKIKSHFPKATESFGEYGKRIIGPAQDDKQDEK